MGKIRIFNKNGIDVVRDKIISITGNKLGKGSQGAPISEEQINEIADLAFNEEYLEKSKNHENVDIDLKKIFSGKYEFIKYIANLIDDETKFEIRGSGLWTWIVICYFKQFLKKTNSGFKINKVERYVLESNNRLRYYRHLAYFPYLAFKKHGENARFMIPTDLSTMGDIIERMQKTKAITNKNLVKMLNDKFCKMSDNGKVNLPKGFTGRYGPGTLIRLVQDSIGQIRVNYDLYECKSEKIYELLPDDFKEVAFD